MEVNKPTYHDQIKVKKKKKKPRKIQFKQLSWVSFNFSTTKKISFNLLNWNTKINKSVHNEKVGVRELLSKIKEDNTIMNLKQLRNESIAPTQLF